MFTVFSRYGDECGRSRTTAALCSGAGISALTFIGIMPGCCSGVTHHFFKSAAAGASTGPTAEG